MDRTGRRSSGRSFPRPSRQRKHAAGCSTPFGCVWYATLRCRRTGQARWRCAPNALAAWAERATSAELASLKGAWIKPAAQGGSNGLVLVTGAIGSLPLMTEGVRFWGAELLIPLGFKAVPDLPPAAIRSAAGATKDELAVLDEDGLELIPWAIFKPLSRAAVRLIADRGVASKEASR